MPDYYDEKTGDVKPWNRERFYDPMGGTFSDTDFLGIANELARLERERDEALACPQGYWWSLTLDCMSALRVLGIEQKDKGGDAFWRWDGADEDKPTATDMARVMKERLDEWESELIAAHERIQILEGPWHCVWCGALIPTDPESQKAHDLVCPDHPMRRIEKAVLDTDAKLFEAQQEIRKLRLELVKACERISDAENHIKYVDGDGPLECFAPAGSNVAKTCQDGCGHYLCAYCERKELAPVGGEGK